MFNFISSFIRIYRSCTCHSFRTYGKRNRLAALGNACNYAKVVASNPSPVAWVAHSFGWSPVGMVEIDGEWVPEGDPYYYLAATGNGFLPIPWWESHSFMGDETFALRMVDNSEEAIKAEEEYIYGW